MQPLETHTFNLYSEGVNKNTITWPLREATRGIVHDIANEVHDRFPHFTANQATVAGAFCGVTGALLARHAHERNLSANHWLRNTAFTLMLAGIGLDGLDGGLARAIATRNPDRPVEEIGSLYNSIADITRETIENLVGIEASYNEGNVIGQILATGTTILNPIQRRGFWRRSSEGDLIPESGRDLLEAPGTHIGKPLAFALKTAYRRIGNIPIAEIVDGVTIASQLVSIARNTGEYTGENMLDEKARRVAEIRKDFHGVTSIVVPTVVFATHYALRKLDKKMDE